jgi:hypothetical protein
VPVFIVVLSTVGLVPVFIDENNPLVNDTGDVSVCDDDRLVAVGNVANVEVPVFIVLLPTV